MADVAYFDRCSSIEAAIGRTFAAAGNDARIPIMMHVSHCCEVV
jgi:hypothetical protein